MHESDDNPTLGRLLRERPGRAVVLERLGVDYAGLGDVPLAEATAAAGVDPEHLREALAEDDRHQAEADATSPPDWQVLPLGDAPEQLIETYHEWFDETLPRLAELAARARKAAADPQGPATELAEVLARFRDELADELREEREEVYPRLHELAAIGGQADFPWGSIGSAVRDMVEQHDTTTGQLRRLAELTDDYRVPDDAPPLRVVLVEGLRELEQRYLDFVDVEHDVVFPRALKEEQRLSQRHRADSDETEVADDLPT